MKAFTWVARVESLSLVLLLFVAMPLKYGAGVSAAVTQVGRAHGVLVVVFLVALAAVAVRERWSAARVAWAVIASMIPFGFVFFEASLRHPGLPRPVASTSSGEPGSAAPPHGAP